MNSSTEQIAILPRDFISAPLFPPKKQDKPREIMVRGVKWEIGIPEPSTDATPSPAFDIRHLRASGSLLTFRNPNQPELTLSFSMNEFCKRYADTQGGRYSRDLLDILLELRKTWVRRTLSNGDIHEFTILGFVNIHKKFPKRKNSKLSKQQELWLDSVSLHPEFFTLLTDLKGIGRIRNDVLNSITSPLAQSIYSYIPSRAVKRTKENPFPIMITTLLEELNESVPEEKKERKKKFVRQRKGQRSIIEQLNGLELVNGKLCVDIAETTDKKDWKLLFWVEGVKQVALPSSKKLNGNKDKLLGVYLQYRGDKQTFDRLMKRKTKLDYYQTDMLKAACIDYTDSEKFLEMVKAIIGEGHFNMILGELKNEINEGQTKIDDPARVLTYRLMHVVKNPS